MPHDDDHLACMEVRGGNVPADVSLDVPGLAMHVLSRPYKGELGGDVHYVSSCGTGRITRMLLADVAGHGVDVAGTARTLHALMQRYVNHIEPTRFVMRLNDAFTRLTADGVFATAIIATYFAPTRRLSVVNAGHPAPLIYRVATGAWSLLEQKTIDESPRNFPLGIFDHTKYQSFDIDLNPGDALVCYTDSLPETRVGESDLLGVANLVKLARTLDHGQALADWLRDWVSTIESQSQTRQPHDDLTVVMLRAVGGRSRARFHQRLLGVSKTLAAPLLGKGWQLPEFNLPNLGGSLFHRLSGQARTK